MVYAIVVICRQLVSASLGKTHVKFVADNFVVQQRDYHDDKTVMPTLPPPPQNAPINIAGL